jgi:hypothetical protein
VSMSRSDPAGFFHDEYDHSLDLGVARLGIWFRFPLEGGAYCGRLRMLSPFHLSIYYADSPQSVSNNGGYRRVRFYLPDRASSSFKD